MPTMRKPKSIGTVVKAGQVVKIIRPVFVVRVGYPMDWYAETQRIMTEKRDVIRQFLADQGIHSGIYGEPLAFEKIAKAIAYDLCKNAGFGGRERTIHTITLAEYQDREFTVKSVRFVKTGEWARGGSFEDGNEPNYLVNERTHRILKTHWYEYPSGDSDEWPERWMMDDWRNLEIEAANVELVGGTQ